MDTSQGEPERPEESLWKIHLHLSDDQGWRLEIKKYRKSEIRK